MAEQKQDVEHLEEPEEFDEGHHPFMDDESYEKRKKAARVFAMLGIVVFAVWGASFFQRAFPHRIELRYIYKDVPEPGQLLKVVASVHDQDGLKGSVVFFHHDPIPNAGERYFRKQTLKLAKGTYKINVLLRYKAGQAKKMTTRLSIREAGRYYVYLKRAE